MSSFRFEFQLSRSSFTKLLLCLLITSYLVVAIGLTFSPSSKLRLPFAAYDARLSGIDPDGWMKEQVHFQDFSVLDWSAFTSLVLEPGTASRQDPPVVIVSNRSRAVQEVQVAQTQKIGVRSEPTAELRAVETGTIATASKLSRVYAGLDVQLRTLNPQPISSGDSRVRGAKLTSLEISPRFLLLLPSPKFAVPVILFCLVWLFGASACTFEKTNKTIHLKGPAVGALIATAALSTMPTTEWARLLPLWGGAVLAFCGAFAARALISEKSSGKTTTNDFSSLLTMILLMCILLLALSLRSSGTHFGMPKAFHPEEKKRTEVAFQMYDEGQMSPGYFSEPSLLFYTTLGNLNAKRIAGVSVHKPSQVLFAGREVSALAGMLSVLFVFFIARELKDNRAGIVAAAMLAVFPGMVTHSRYFAPPSLFILLFLSACYLVLLYLRTRKVSHFVAAGLLVGLLSSTSYWGIIGLGLLLLPPVVAIVLSVGKKYPSVLGILGAVPKEHLSDPSFRTDALVFSLVAILLAGIGFILGTPFAVLDPSTFGNQILDKSGESIGITIAPLFSEYLGGYYFINSVLPAMTPATVLVGIFVFGWVAARGDFRRRGFLLIILTAYFIPELVLQKSLYLPERAILPVVALFTVVFGIAFSEMITNTILKQHRYARIGVVLVVLVAFSLPFVRSVQDAYRIVPDSREQLAQYLSEAFSQQDILLIDDSAFVHTGSSFSVIELTKGRAFVEDFSLAKFLKENVSAVILSSFFYEPFLNDLNPQHHTMASQVQNFFSRHEPKHRIDSDKPPFGVHQPRFRVFDLRNYLDGEQQRY